MPRTAPKPRLTFRRLLIFAALWCGLPSAAIGQTTLLPTVQTPRASVDGSELVLSFTLAAPPRWALKDIDLLFAVSAESSSQSPVALLADRQPRGRTLDWQRGNLTSNETVTLSLELLVRSPMVASRHWLTHDSDGIRFVRYRLSRATTDASTPVEVRLPLPTDHPLRQAATLHVASDLLGLDISPLTAETVLALGRSGIPGLGALSDAVGADSTGRQRRRISERNPALLDDLVRLLDADTMVSDDAYGALAAWLLIADLAPEVFDRILQRELTDAAVLAPTVNAALARDRAEHPLRVRIVEERLAPVLDDGESELGTAPPPIDFDRLTAGALARLTPKRFRALMDSLSDEAMRSDRMSSIGRALAPSLATAIHRLPPGTLARTLNALADWGASNALPILLADGTPDRFGYAVKAIGREAVDTAARSMSLGGFDEALIDVLGSEDKARRSLAAELIRNGGSAALRAVVGRLRRRGQLPADVSEQQLSNATNLPMLASKLQGVLLFNAGKRYYDEAWRLHHRGADCTEVFERAQRELHPQLLLPEPLYSRCRALKAVNLSADGQLEAAMALIGQVLQEGRNDPVVRDRWVEIAIAVARRELEAGDYDSAISVIEQVDPKQEHPDLVPILADLRSHQGDEAKAAGDLDAARDHYLAAWELDPSLPHPDAIFAEGSDEAQAAVLSILLLLALVAILAVAARFSHRSRVIRDFYLLTDTAPVELLGFGGRRVLLAPHGVLALNRLGWRLIAWSEVDQAFLLPGATDRSGVLLYSGVGSPFVLTPRAAERFDRLVDLTRDHLQSVGKVLDSAKTLDDPRIVENDTVMDTLKRRETLRLVALRAGLFVALGVLWALAVLDLGTGFTLPIRLAVAAGFALSTWLLGVTLTDTALALPRS